MSLEITVDTPRSTFSHVKAILTGSLGNLIEWYDVYVYAAFQLYFAGSFFKDKDLNQVQLYAALVFSFGYLARPFGGFLIGYFADRFGRRRAMILTILMMCAGSMMIGLCPTADDIGIAAPMILLFARLIQGISLGGEYGTSTSYLAEVAPPNRRGFYSGVWYTTLIGGQFVAILVLLVLQKLFLTPDQLKAWGWRIPFIIGGCLSLFTLAMRRNLAETSHFESVKKNHANLNTLKMLFANWKLLLIVIGFTAGGTSAFYTYTTYMQRFLKLSVKLTDDQTTLVVAGVLLVAICLQPLYGALSDKVGRKPLLIWFGVMGVLGTYPLLTTLRETKDPLIAFFIICAAWVIVSGYTSITAIVKAEMFPTAIRAIGVGFPYAIAGSLFGGTIESVALSFKQQGHEEWFYFYATGLIFISLIFYVFLGDTKKTSRMEQDV